MYNIYIKNFKNASGTEVSTETLVYSIPITSNFDYVLTDPVVKTEMGKTGTFEFTVNPDHPLYNCWLQMRTLMRVDYDGDTIFRGRVLTIDNTLFGEKKVHCEGDLAFLMDSQQPGTKEEKRTEITIYAYLTQIINNHNTQMAEAGNSEKSFTLGEVPGNYSNSITEDQKVNPDATKKYGSDSWETTMSALESLQKNYGGYFRTRYVNGTIYLDWLDTWFATTENTQPIQISENLIDLQSSAEVDNIFTALVPIGSSKSEEVLITDYKTDVHGANNRILVPQIVGEFTDAELNRGYHSKTDYQNAVTRYGIIYKTEKFENADTPEKLWNYACDYIKNNYIGGLTGFDLTALDMHHIDGTVMKYLCGDRVPVIYPDLDSRSDGVTPTIQKVLSATQISYNLHNPDKNTYNLGIPNGILNKKYGTAANKGGGGGGGSKKQAEEQLLDEELAMALDNDKSELGQIAWTYVINEKYNNAEYQALLAKDTKLQYAPAVLKSSKGIIKEILDPVPGRLQEVADSIILSGGKLEMNASLQDCKVLNPLFVEGGKSINSIVFNAYDANIELKQKMLTSTILEMKDNPLKTTARWSADQFSGKLEMWKKDNLPEDLNPTLSAMVKGEDGTIANVLSLIGLDGSGEKSTIMQNGLTSMLQFFNPVSAATTSPTETAQINGDAGTGKVGKDGNGNWQVKLNDEITYVDKDNVQRTAKGFVSAKDFNIPEVASFKTKLAVVDTLIANRATINQLEAAEARITTLETDCLKTVNLASAIANISTLNAQAISCASISSSRGGGSFASLSVAGTGYSFRSKYVITSIDFTAATCETTDSVTVGETSGSLVTSFSGGSCTPDGETIEYLGCD